MKLSNWERLVRTPLPAFVLYLEFDGGSDCQRAFLTHVWSDEIGRVLKHLRELSRDRPGTDLRKHALSLPPRPDASLSVPFAVSFLDRLNTDTGAEPQEYAQAKRRLVTGLGYEEGPGKITTRVTVPEGWTGSWSELWADLQLGILPKLETRGAEFWDVRFGIQTNEPQKVFTTVGSLVPEKIEPQRHGPIEFKAESKIVRFDADIYAAPISTPVRSLGDLKYRISFSSGEIVVARRSQGAGVAAQFSWKWPDDGENILLRDLVPLASTLQLLTQEKTVELAVMGYPFATLEGQDHSLGAEARLATIILNAWAVAKVLDLQDGMMISLRDLDQQENTFDFAAKILTQRRLQGHLRIDVDDPDGVPTGRCAVPQVLGIWFSDEIVWLPLAHIGTASLAKGAEIFHFILEPEDVRVGELIRRPRTEEPDTSSLMENAAGLARNVKVVRWWEHEPR